MINHMKWHHALSQVTGSMILQRKEPDVRQIAGWAKALLEISKSMLEEIEK